MKWVDLAAHGMALTVGNRADQPALCIEGTSGESAALTRLGFAQDGQRWWRPGTQVPGSFWRELTTAFPKAVVVDMAVDQVFGRQAPANAPEARTRPVSGGVLAGDIRQVSYTTVGEHRGKRRLWLEGLRLGEAGFAPGARYAVTLDTASRSITLSLDDAGDRQVSKRTRQRRSGPSETPIIDVASEGLADVLGDAGRVKAVVADGEIRFTLHPADQARMEREARTRMNIREGRITEGTVCAGGGVSTLAIHQGFEQAGLAGSVEWVVDREQRYLQAAIDNNEVIEGARILMASVEELERMDLTPVDALTCSLPCTGHSLSGKAKRGLKSAEEHPTDALAVYGLLKTIEATNPSAVISENVTQAADSATYALVRAYLKEQGYVMAEVTLDGHDAGTVENRKRWWLVALSKGFAEGLSLENLPKQDRRYAKLGDAMEAVPADSPMWSKNEYLAIKAERDKAAGKGFARQFVDEDSETIGCIGRGYAKRRGTEPAVSREDGMERLLTPIEHARVKGIPEKLVEDLSAQLAHEILGQSILFGHAKVLAKRVGDHLVRAVQREDEAGVVEVGPEPARQRTLSL